MPTLSYTLIYTPNSGPQGQSQGLFNLNKKAMPGLSRESPILPNGIAGLNLETKRKYCNLHPPIHGFSKKITQVFRNMGYRIRERFSRDYKPVDHLGGASPIERMNLHAFMTANRIDQDLEGWPKSGSTFEDMDVMIL